MFKSPLRLFAAVLLLLGIGAAPAHSEDEILLLDHIELNSTESETFTVQSKTDVHITAVGAQWGNSESMYAYPWIINAETHNLVWSMDDDFTRPVKDSESLRQFDDEVELYPGTYTLYYYACQPFFFGSNFDFSAMKINLKDLDKDIEELLKKLGISDEDIKNKHDTHVISFSDMTDKLYVRLAGDPEIVAADSYPDLPEPVVALEHPENDAYLSEGFTLTSEADLQIYSIGEYSTYNDAMVDWGWIIDANTRDHVWEMKRNNTDWAGGADKNRRFRDRRRFPAGNYVAYYVTDDSHTYNDWNANPPYDPDGYGLSIYVVDPDDRSKIKPYEDAKEEKPIVRLTKVGDNERLSEAFRVESPANLRIYAIGEYDRFRDKMADYAWVTQPDGHRKVWVMTYDDTEPAGGDTKNRLFDGVVSFEPGDYVLYYVSDGSHSYAGGWNAAPPYDQKSYGVSIFPADQDHQPQIVLINKDDIKHKRSIAEITDLGNNENRRTRFSLSSPTRVNVQAMGEGTRYGMVDYGWIENETTGDVVWEMTYRKTSHAGGADKNRLVNQTILLDKGEYVVHFVTDDSHTARDPNAELPEEPVEWGIVLTKADKTGDN